MRLPRPVLRLAALALGGLAGLLAAEGLVRGVWLLRHGTSTDRGGYSDRFLEHHERFGWLGIPGRRVRHRTTEFDVELAIDDAGLRGSAVGSGRRRVCLLGDSFAFGHGVEQHERLGDRLSALEPELTVHTVALPGLGTDQQLLLYRELEGPHAEAELVILLYFLDGVARNGARSRHGLAKPWFELEGGELVLRGIPVPDLSGESPPPSSEAGSLTTLRTWLRRHSALHRLLRRQLVTHAPTLVGGAEDPYPEYTNGAPAWSRTVALFEALRDAAAERGARLGLVVVPGLWHLVEGRTQAHQEAVLEACEQLGIPALDLTPVLAGSSGEGGRDAYFPSDGHWRPQGHERAAQAIRSWLPEW